MSKTTLPARVEDLARNVALSRACGIDENQAYVLLLLAESKGYNPGLAAKFLRQIEPIAGCFVWRGSTTPNLYGKFYMGGRSVGGFRMPDGAHRASYRMFVGSIPDGLEIDHLCHNTLCVHPFHIRAVTHRENLMASDSMSARYAQATTCKRGHPKTPENTYFYKGRAYACRVCQANRDRERNQRKDAGR